MRVSHKKFLIFLLGLFVLSYGFFQARDYLYGPRLFIENPKNGAEFNESLLTVKGRALDTSYLILNGRAIFTDTDGNFSEELLLALGLNRIKLEAKDKFGKQISIERMVVLK